MKIVVDLGQLSDRELTSWVAAFTSASTRAYDPLLAAFEALLDAGRVERLRREQGGSGSRTQDLLLLHPDLDPAVAADARDSLIRRVQGFRDAPWIGPNLAEALHSIALAIADDRDRVRHEQERVEAILDSRFFRGSAPA